MQKVYKGKLILFSVVVCKKAYFSFKFSLRLEFLGDFDF